MGFDDNGNDAGAVGKRAGSHSGGSKPADLIASKLKTFYEGVTEEGTPDHLLTLLEKLDAAEKAASSRKND